MQWIRISLPPGQLNLPLFSGERSATAVTSWLAIFERAIKTYQWNEASAINTATTWLLTFELEHPTMSWSMMSTGLTDAFRPTFSHRDRRDQLASLRQPGTVGAYIDSFLEITLDIPSMTTEEKVDRFVRGLKSNIRCHVEAFDPTTLKDAQRLALSKSLAVTSSINDRLSAPTPADPMDLDALDMARGRRRFPRGKTRNHSTSGCVERRTCHNCGMTGHLRSNCRVSTTSRPSTGTPSRSRVMHIDDIIQAPSTNTPTVSSSSTDRELIDLGLDFDLECDSEP
ncbi:unnamed protein product [Absidia cylindrospora]